MKKLDNKVAVVTGGNSGIGLATAVLFAKEGAKVAITGRSKAGINSAVAAIGHSALGIVSDVSDIKNIEALPYLNDGASVIITSSTLAVKGAPGDSVYSATKGAVNTLAKVFSAELADCRIRVNVLSPGPIDTPIMTRDGATVEEYRNAKDYLSNRTFFERLGASEEIAEGFLFLASNSSRYMTGSELLIDQPYYPSPWIPKTSI